MRILINIQKFMVFLFFMSLLVSFGCNRDDSELEVEEVLGCTNPLSANYNPEANSDDGSCAPFNCAQCTYTVPANASRINGKDLNLKGGDFVCLNSEFNYGALLFENLHGEIGNPITIINCGGAVKIQRPVSASYVLKTMNSRHIRVSGQGHPSTEHGIILQGGNLGISFEYLSSDFEVNHLEFIAQGFAGIMAKTDPSCDDATIRGNFTMRNIEIHDNKITDSGGESIYVGNSFYQNGRNLDCGVRLPHDIVGVNIYNNKIKNSGWEAIQLGCAIEGAKIYDNHIDGYGSKNVKFQNNGIQIGEGTGGLCYNNHIMSGPGSGIIVLGLGDNIVFNNVILDAGEFGIFCDERFTPGSSFSFINNTIINSGSDGIRLYSNKVDINHVKNNVIINPGSFEIYEKDNTGRTGMDAFIYKLNNEVKLDANSNFLTRNISDVNFENPGNRNFAPKLGSPLVDGGVDVKSFGVDFDINNRARPKGNGFDIGAYELNE